MGDSLGDVINGAAAAALAQAFMCRPGRVQSYDAATNTCSVQPLLPVLFEAGGEQVSQSCPVLNEVPVLTLRAGGVSFTVRPAQGETVLLLFVDRCLEKLLHTGQADEPGDPRHHDMMDALALPVFFTFKDVPRDTDVPSIGRESTDTSPGVRVYFPSNELWLGGKNPTKRVALAEDVEARFAELYRAFSWIPVPSDGGAALKASLVAAGLAAAAPVPPGVPTPWPGPLGSNIVKVKE